MAPVTAMLELVAAANLWVWLSVFGGAATAALAHRVVGSERRLSWQASSPRLRHTWQATASAGVHERLAIWVFLVVAGPAPGATRADQALVGLALGLFVATVGCQVYGVFTLCRFWGCYGGGRGCVASCRHWLQWAAVVGGSGGGAWAHGVFPLACSAARSP